MEPRLNQSRDVFYYALLKLLTYLQRVLMSRPTTRSIINSNALYKKCYAFATHSYFFYALHFSVQRVSFLATRCTKTHATRSSQHGASTAAFHSRRRLCRVHSQLAALMNCQRAMKINDARAASRRGSPLLAAFRGFVRSFSSLRVCFAHMSRCG